MLPDRPLTRDQIRRADRIAIDEFAVPGLVLMENAGRNAAEVIRREALPSPDSGRVAILCGSGNNGGDGFVIARHLANAGVDASVYLAADPARLAGDAATNFRIVQTMGLPLFPLADGLPLAAARERWRGCDVVVDALLGTGFTGAVRAPLLDIIAALNALPREPGPPQRPLVVAIDLPSGLDADTGRPSGAAVKADLTVTMLARKIGFDAPGVSALTGRVIVVDIGAPVAVIDRVLAG